MSAQQMSSNLRELDLWQEFRESRRHTVREELLQVYEPFARSIAARMYKTRVDNSVSFADYSQYGRVGLIEALERYETSRDVTFRAFAASRIRGAILDGLAKESEVAAQHRFWQTHVGDRVGSLRTAVAPAIERASLAQIAIITAGLAIGILLDDFGGHIEPVDHNPRNSPYEANETRQLKVIARNLIGRLPDNERLVIVGHYVEQLEFKALAQRMSLTKGRVAQIHARALLRLRDWLEQPQLDRKL